MPNISQAIKNAQNLMAGHSPSALIDSQVLLCHVLRCNSAYLMTWPEKILDETQEERFNALVKRRKDGVPVAYITGEKEFWSLRFKVTADALIPRPETELLIETVLSKFKNKNPLQLVDLGTGSGAIAIALAHSRPRWNITATDIAGKALVLAKTNADRHRLNNIHFIDSDWFEKLDNQTFDIVISNPPYIAENEEHLNQGDIRFEPQKALVSGLTGMDDIIKITSQSTTHLKNEGWLILEHGYDQKTLVFDCLKNSGFINIIQKADLSGTPRLTMGQYIIA